MLWDTQEVSASGKSFGPYLIQGEIARGGQGAVYRGHHTPSGSAVAIKLLLDNSPRNKKRFAQEATILTRLSHPNLLRVTDSGEHGEMNFMAMEFVDGTNLSDLVKEQGVPDVEWTCSVLADVASALEYCHGQGLVHRDLKPENVMIESESGRPVLVDFGLVKRDAEQMRLSALDSGGGNTLLTKTGEIRGTPIFMAPEQAGSKQFGEITPKTDVYGLGGVLFFLLTGQTPFTGTTLLSVMAQVMGDDPPNPQTLNPSVPTHLAQLALHALSKSPDDRPVSAAAFRDALSPGGARSRGHRGRWPLVLSLGLNVVLVAAVAWALATRPQEPLQSAGDVPTPADLAPRAGEAVLREADALLATESPEFERVFALLDGASDPTLAKEQAQAWVRLAERLILRKQSLLGARTCLRVATALGKGHPDALNWVDRAFELDPREASVSGVPFADEMLRWCKAVLDVAAGTPEEVPRLKLVRRRLFQFRLIDSEAEIAPEILGAVLRIGQLPRREVREALLPGSHDWRADWSDLVRTLEARLTPTMLRRPNMVANTHSPNLESVAWRTWLKRSDQQTPARQRAMLEEWLLFRPEFAVLWSKLSHLEGTRLGNWGRAYRLRELGATKALVKRHWALGRVALTLLRLGRFEESVDAYTKAFAADSDVENPDVQWATFSCADALVGAGRPAEALSRLDTIHDQWLRVGGYWKSRAAILAVLGRDDEAADAQRKYERLARK